MDSSQSSQSRYYWSEWFLSLKGSEFFCEVDEDFILDRFNLTGLVNEVPQFSLAYDLITDNIENDIQDESIRLQVEKSSRHLYGLLHSRFITTSRGLSKMKDKWKAGDFGKCPRVLCHGFNLLPVGTSDNPGLMSVKLYCARCQDIYIPPNKRHQSTDGAYFGTSFPHFLMQVHADISPVEKNMEQYVPRIFGFKVHALVCCFLNAG